MDKEQIMEAISMALDNIIALEAMENAIPFVDEVVETEEGATLNEFIPEPEINLEEKRQADIQEALRILKEKL